MSRAVGPVTLLCCCTVLLLVVALPIYGETEKTDSRLHIHGFLTQAYATADYLEGGTSPRSADELALGIPEDGTFDYRFLALQFRYEMSPKDNVVVQLSSRSLGDAPVGQVEDEIELDWAFFEHRFTDQAGLKVGRVQIPIGIYNEIRDVGTLLPFYRPPFSFYREGSFTSETVDGLLLYKTFFADSDWGLEADLYVGEWTQLEVSPTDTEVAGLARAKDALGVQLWLSTPVPGLRFGLGGHRKRLEGGAFRPPGTEDPHVIEDWYVSLDGTFDHFVIRSEYHEFDPVLQLPVVEDFLNLSAWYVQLGYLATDKLQLWLQLEEAGIEANSVLHTRPENLDARQDLGAAIKYRFRPDVVLKAEHHWVEEEQGVLVPVFGPQGLRLDPLAIQADNGSYTIVSLSVSF